MGYASGWNDGLSFNNLGRAIGLKGIKPMLDHAGDSLGLNGFDKAGKAHGTNALGGLLIFGGAQAAGAMGGGLGGLGGAGGSAGAAGGAGSAGSMTGGLLNFSGTQAAAPIADASVAATPQTMQGVAPSFGGGAAGGGSFSSYMGDASKLANIGQQSGLLGGQTQKVEQPQMQQQQANPQAFTSAMTPVQQADTEKRLRAQQMAVQGLLGGYGRSYG